VKKSFVVIFFIVFSSSSSLIFTQTIGDTWLCKRDKIIHGESTISFGINETGFLKSSFISSEYKKIKEMGGVVYAYEKPAITFIFNYATGNLYDVTFKLYVRGESNQLIKSTIASVQINNLLFNADSDYNDVLLKLKYDSVKYTQRKDDYHVVIKIPMGDFFLILWYVNDSAKSLKLQQIEYTFSNVK
jgi:hypothetical protein